MGFPPRSMSVPNQDGYGTLEAWLLKGAVIILGRVWKRGVDGNLEELCKLWDGSHSVLGQSPPSS